jgi:hypothetical protein
MKLTGRVSSDSHFKFRRNGLVIIRSARSSNNVGDRRSFSPLDLPLGPLMRTALPDTGITDPSNQPWCEYPDAHIVCRDHRVHTSY